MSGRWHQRSSIAALACRLGWILQTAWDWAVVRFEVIHWFLSQRYRLVRYIFRRRRRHEFAQQLSTIIRIYRSILWPELSRLNRLQSFLRLIRRRSLSPYFRKLLWMDAFSCCSHDLSPCHAWDISRWHVIFWQLSRMSVRGWLPQRGYTFKLLRLVERNLT